MASKLPARAASNADLQGTDSPSVPCMKGAYTLDLVKPLRARRDEALKVLPPRLHEYLTMRILPSSWYPDADHMELRKALATLNKHIPDIWAMFGQVSARNNSQRLYKALITPGDPARTFRNLPRGWSQYHNTGRLVTTIVEDEKGLFEIHDWPTSSNEMCQSLGAYYAKILRISGATEVRFVSKPVGPRTGRSAAYAPIIKSLHAVELKSVFPH